MYAAAEAMHALAVCVMSRTALAPHALQHVLPLLLHRHLVLCAHRCRSATGGRLSCCSRRTRPLRPCRSSWQQQA